jgi:hypothetical protein
MALPLDTYSWMDGLIPLFEVQANDATSSDELHYQIGNGYGVLNYEDPYWTLSSSGTLTTYPLECHEITGTITVKDANGEPINNLTRDNFEIKDVVERPYANHPGFRSYPLEQYETKVTSLGQGTYQINQLLGISVGDSGNLGRFKITVSIVSAPGTGTIVGPISSPLQR